MYNPRAFKRQFTALHIICLAHKLNTSVYCEVELLQELVAKAKYFLS